MMLKEKQMETVNATKTVNQTENSTLTNFNGGIFTCALIAFLISSARIGGSGIPICVSFIAVLNPIQALAAFMGSMVSFFLNGTIDTSIMEIASMLGLIIIKGLSTGILNKPNSYKIVTIMAGTVYFAISITISFFMKISIAIIAVTLFRAVLCSIVAFFIYSVLTEYNSSGKISVFGEKCMPTAVIYILLICGFCTVSFGYFNLGRAAAAFVLLAFTSKYGASGGAAIGALSSLGVALFSYDLGKSMIILACTGLLAGAFANYGKLTSAVVFIISNLIGTVIIGMPTGTVNLMTDIVIAAVIFVIIPDYVYTGNFAFPVGNSSPNLKLFSDRLMFASLALNDVRGTVNKAAETLNKRENYNDISEKVCCKVCKDCRSSAFCGDDAKHRTNAYFVPVENILKKKGYIIESDLPNSLEFCPKKPVLVEEFNRFYRAELMEKRFGEESGNMRNAALEQLSSAEEMLKSFGMNATVFPYCDDKMSAAVKKIIDINGAKNSSVTVFFDENNHIYIECFYENLLSVKMETLTEKISDTVDRELDTPVIATIGKVTKLCLHEIPIYTVDVGHARKNGRENVSGDADNIFSDGFGNMYFIISDGMGSGSRAAVESCMTVSLLSRLLKAGIGCSAAVKLINLLMLTKSSDEIFATIDLLSLNLFTGKVDIIKLGAAQTFIKNGGSIKSVESFSTPVGIVSSIEFDIRTAILKEDDCFVMLTDGISEECFPRVRELMLSTGMTSQRVADEIIAYSECIKSAIPDDKTVITVKICKV